MLYLKFERNNECNEVDGFMLVYTIGRVLFIKSPVGNLGLYTNKDFSAKNIRFKIRKKENLVLFIKSPLGT
jgi:hypothetical protein